jgi:hypothetical protein
MKTSDERANAVRTGDDRGGFAGPCTAVLEAGTDASYTLLVTPGGGLNSRVSNWPTAVFNAMEAFKNDFRWADQSTSLTRVCYYRNLKSRNLFTAKLLTIVNYLVPLL